MIASVDAENGKVSFTFNSTLLYREAISDVDSFVSTALGKALTNFTVHWA